MQGCDLCRYTEAGEIRWPAGEDPHDIYDRLKTSIAYGEMVREALAAALAGKARIVKRIDPDQFHPMTWVHATDKAVIIADHGAPDPHVFTMTELPAMLRFYRHLTGVHFQRLADALEDIQAAAVTKEQEGAEIMARDRGDV